MAKIVGKSKTRHRSQETVKRGNSIWTKLRKNAEKIEAECLQKGDVDLLREVHRLAILLTLITQLYCMFRKANGIIKGKGGVADLLGISRFGVYTRAKAIGCDAERFRDLSLSLDDHLKENSALKERVDHIKHEARASGCKELDWSI